jgi:TolA-binding protein
MSRSLRIFTGACLAAWAATTAPSAQSQNTPEEFARRQYESGLEFLRSGKTSEALKDFQAVLDGYPNTSVADDAMLAVARTTGTGCCSSRATSPPAGSWETH